jgi:SnoaL-like domain
MDGEERQSEIGVMKSTLLLLALTASSPARADRDAKVDIAHVLDELNDAAAKADEARYFGLYAPGAVFLGTDGKERWDLAAFRAFAHPHFAKGKAWSFRSVRRAIALDEGGRVAWFDEDLDTPNLGPCRGSGVLLRQDGAWKIAQYNLAVVLPNERLDEVRALLAKPAPARPPASTGH